MHRVRGAVAIPPREKGGESVGSKGASTWEEVAGMWIKPSFEELCLCAEVTAYVYSK